jgi:hypothetical protein
MKNPLKWVIAAIDKKMERFDPLVQAEKGTGGLRSRYNDKTGIARYREWRGVEDTLFHYVSWLKNLGYMGAMVGKAPIRVVKGMWEYRWMASFLGTFAFIDRCLEGYRGPTLRIGDMHMNTIVKSVTGKLGTILANDRRFGDAKDSDRLIGIDETLPPLFMAGFPNLIPIAMQTFPEFLICDIDQQLEPHYIDVAESFGLPADVCSRCAAETGVAMDDDFPIYGKAILITNMPCNASEATSMFQTRRIGLPDFPFMLPMIHNAPEAHPYTEQMLRDAIAFIEEQYGEKFDWDALFEKAKNMNEQNTYELQKWDFFKTPYSPLTGISETLYRLYGWASANGLEEHFTLTDRKVMKIMHKCYDEPVRSLRWQNPPPGFPLGAFCRLLHRFPDLDTKLLGCQYRAEYGLHDGLQHDRHRRFGTGAQRPGDLYGKRRHASPRRRRLGKRERPLGVGRELQLRFHSVQRQRSLQGDERRPRLDGRAGEAEGNAFPVC